MASDRHVLPVFLSSPVVYSPIPTPTLILISFPFQFQLTISISFLSNPLRVVSPRLINPFYHTLLYCTEDIPIGHSIPITRQRIEKKFRNC